ncbi:MAG TPA: tetratricopeptide repeat protein [Xanthobacteraceae bacterium]|nr:tetratricopeptide repeat protein [Xanthobacteraceae bacterium]
MTPAEDLFQEAIIAINARKLTDAESLFKALLQSDPNHVAALNLLTVVLMSQERFAEAEPFIGRALSLSQNSDVSFYNHGMILKKLGKPIEALEQFDRALQLNEKSGETWNARGSVFNDLQQYDRAISDFDKAISMNERDYGAHFNKARSLHTVKRYEEALVAYDKALALRPNLAEAWLDRGNLFTELKRHSEALAAYDRAIALKPDTADAWVGRGNACYEFKRYIDALAAYNRALALKPQSVEAWIGLGSTSWELKLYRETFEAYDKALALKPDFEFLEGVRLHAKMHCCDWSNLAEERKHLIAAVRDGKAGTQPFNLLGISESADDELKCAKLWAAKKWPPSDKPFWNGEIYRNDRVAIAYLSPDFHEHPVSYLLAGLFECHDKSKFRITAISTGPDDNSPLRQRLKASFEQFIDARNMTDDEIASRIRNERIDILIDLNGFTQGARPGIFARRPAPIQVSYLGYPATMGTDYIDYLIADRTLVPERDQVFYTEKIAYLPDSYQANDGKRAISDKPLTRAEFGLPEQDFVFCCFNNIFKILPGVFDCWMRILRRTDGSVLWLKTDYDGAIANLRKEAAARGIAAERLVFANRMPSLPEHLARHRVADLFLDTLPYNAHTTASDALWAGLPFLTQIGCTFAGRVGASVLNAMGLPELITRTQEEYESMALELAANPDKLLLIRNKLAQNRLSAPLFNTPLFTRHIEKALESMYERYQAKLQPDHIYPA